MGILFIATSREINVIVNLAIDLWKNHTVEEFASDCEIENKESYEFHVKYGFNVANRIICFAKKIV